MRFRATFATGGVLPDAIGPGAEGQWDDLATWTGSVVPHQERWYMLYTGNEPRGGGLTHPNASGLPSLMTLSTARSTGNPALRLTRGGTSYWTRAAGVARLGGTPGFSIIRTTNTSMS